ncbi:MAG TPA: BMP family ABC transporter substrate-binding protein [Thermoclostridium sp.]|nr:BMP family ABC transporter substrate-binding protein [Thermoclostridium sp.]HPU44900.1 BMP family ABC transporter substrate-binding protein [Thermoclostridium sp.]
MALDLTEYTNARKSALKEYSNYISQGRNGYLPFLDGILKNIDIVTEVDLGIVDIPLRKIRGTYTYLRSISFARNFMPLMDVDTEFAVKWQHVYDVQTSEGLNDPIKVYEYLNWFYVIEGNKRVSVLKYLSNYSYQGYVTRLVPKYDETNRDIRLYYEFMDFYKKTGINEIWFSKEGSFNELWEIIKDFCPTSRLVNYEDRFTYFQNAVYNVFRKIFYDLGGDRLPITTGDAFLDFLKIHGIRVSVSDDELKAIMRRFISEMEYHRAEQAVEVQKSPKLKQETGFIGKLTHRLRSEKLKVGFAHANDAASSSWVYSHELGRMHLEHVLNESVETVTATKLPENIEAAPALQKMIDGGCQIIFTTSPSLINATLKVAMENPDVNMLNCSAMHSFKHVNTYFGRIHEPRFLCGLVAGAMTRTGKLGYIAPFPMSDVISGINAFTLGARMIRPDARVYLEWMQTWDYKSATSGCTARIAEQGADIICHQNTLANRQFNREYGVYTIRQDENGEYVPDKYLAVPVWNWGIFYEKYIRSVLVGGTRLGHDTASAGRMLNYWWGMDSGLLDFFYARTHIPVETQKLVEFFKSGIISRSFRIFTGPIRDSEGKLMVDQDEILEHLQILMMDWLVEGVIGSIPESRGYNPLSDLSTGRIAGS